MPRPNISSEQIELPSIDTPMGGFSGKACGTSYYQAFPVYQPYAGVNAYSYPLPKIREQILSKPANQMSSAELEALGTLVGSPAEAIVSAQKMLDGQDAQLPVHLVASGPDTSATPPKVLDAKNVQAIEHLIDRAVYYGNLAAQLWNYWGNEVRPTVVTQIAATPEIQGTMPGWPLNKTAAEALGPCAGQSGTVSWPVEALGLDVEVKCLTQEQHAQHQKDVELYVELVLASLVWARCAQEAAAVMGVYHLNKLKKQQGGGVLGFAPQDLPPEIPDPGQIPLVPGLSAAQHSPGSPPAVPQTSEPPTTMPAKTGLSTPVKVAAAAAALYVVYRLYS